MLIFNNLNKKVVCFLVAAGLVLHVNAAQTNQITQNGITWNFATPVEFGQFVNGDYYVVASGSGVVVSSVSPPSADGRNGSMVNPVTGQQAYDSRLAHYEPTSLVSFPATISGGGSLVSTISLGASDEQNGRYVPTWDSQTLSPSFAKLKTAAVLTVLSSAPAANSFRPPFIGTEKPIYNTAQIQSRYLPAVSAPTTAPSKTVAYYERGLQRPWLTHLPGWECRQLHPIENMLNYHREIGTFLSQASLILVTELATPKLINNFIQTGIDQFHMAKSGRGDSAFFEAQVIQTGLLLGDEAIAKMFVNGTNKTTGRAMEKFYYWEDKRSTISSSIVPPGQTWTGATVFFRKQGGNTEHEHLHPSEWDAVANGGGKKQENYRHCCDSRPHMGMALALRMLGASSSSWPDERLDDYLERWMTEDWAGTWKPIADQYYSGIPNSAKSMGNGFANEMWVIYNDYNLDSNSRAGAPIMDPPPGSYVLGQYVALASLTPGATIRFTSDGTTPTSSSQIYEAPITVSVSSVIRAIATAPDLDVSSVSVGTYNIGQSPVWISTDYEWGNQSFESETETFTASFTLTPAFDNMDGVFGLSDEIAVGNPGGYSALATTVRFNEDGRIDARNGSSYQAENVLNYTAGSRYDMIMDVDVTNKTYDVFVNGITIASDYDFRNGTDGVGQLDIANYFSSFEEMFFTIENFSIPTSPQTPVSPPQPPSGYRVR